MPEDTPQSSIVLYQTEDGRTRIQCRFENETIWLTQAHMAELFQKDVRTINEHLANVFEEGELGREATIRKSRIVRTSAMAGFGRPETMLSSSCDVKDGGQRWARRNCCCY